MSDHANDLGAWLPKLDPIPDRYRVHSARAPGSAMLSVAWNQAEAERIVADLHARGYHARVIRERTIREIVDTTP